MSKNNASTPAPPDETILENALSNPAVTTEPQGLHGVPYLGATRRDALTAAGIKTLADLLAADVAAIGNVKGVGMVNAKKIKEWLAQQNAKDTETL